MEFLERTLLFYLLVHAYLFFSFYRQLGKKRRFLASFPWFILMGLFPLIHMYLPEGPPREIFSLLGTFWLPFAYFCLLVFLAKDILTFLLWFLRALIPSLNWRIPRRLAWPAVFILLCVFAYGTYEARSLHVTRLEIPTSAVSQKDGRVRVVFAADLHIGPQTGKYLLRRCVDRILAEQPDCILLGGDVLDDALQGTEANVEELKRLKAPLGVYAVLGNHDAFGDHRVAVETLRQAGIPVLSGQAVEAGPFYIVGVDDPRVLKQRGEDFQDPVPLLKAAGPGHFTVLLAHQPVLLPGSPGLFDIQLSGHSHGGQIYPLKPLLERKYGTPNGLSRHQGEGRESLLFVTTGVGFSKLPIRFLIPPEIVVIDLVPAPAM